MTHRPSGTHVIVIGAGGNIGSHLVPHLGRMSDIALLTLIDRDRYETSNLASQAIAKAAIGRRKTAVQARIARAINPALRIVPVGCAVEHLPLGRLRADLLLSCLDSRAARQYVNQAAWRLGVPWIDAGVEATGLLARVSIYSPRDDSACLECAWDDRDYETLEQAYPCAASGERGAIPPVATGAPSALGALAAALQALACHRLLRGCAEIRAGREMVLDARTHRAYATALRRNPTCRLPDHTPWPIERLAQSPGRLTLGALFDAAPAGERPTLRVAGHLFLTRLHCMACGSHRPMLRLARSVGRATCRRCGAAMTFGGADLADHLVRDALPARILARPLVDTGFEAGEVVVVGRHGCDRWFEIAGDGR